jgi:hypothetical protein
VTYYLVQGKCLLIFITSFSSNQLSFQAKDLFIISRGGQVRQSQGDREQWVENESSPDTRGEELLGYSGAKLYRKEVKESKQILQENAVTERKEDGWPMIFPFTYGQWYSSDIIIGLVNNNVDAFTRLVSYRLCLRFRRTIRTRNMYWSVC